MERQVVSGAQGVELVAGATSVSLPDLKDSWMPSSKRSLLCPISTFSVSAKGAATATALDSWGSISRVENSPTALMAS